MKFGEAVRAVIGKYATFSGRARRSEFWWWVLFNFLVLIVAMSLDSTLGINFDLLPYGPIYCIAGLAMFIPMLAVQVRRLHDIGKSGWNILWGLIPLLGLLILYWSCLDSQPESNQYGPSPKYGDQGLG